MKLLTYVVVSIPLFVLVPLWLVWSFLHGLAGGQSKDTQGEDLLSKPSGPFPSWLPHVLLGFALLPQACSCRQLLGLICNNLSVVFESSALDLNFAHQSHHSALKHTDFSGQNFPPSLRQHKSLMAKVTCKVQAKFSCLIPFGHCFNPIN